MFKNASIRHPARKYPSLILAAVFIVLSGCQDETGSQPKTSGEALVRVNNDEITLRQVNYVLAHLSEGQRRDEVLVEKIVEQFVDQQLLLQKALENKLDQDPNVLLALEQTRRQVLAQAYLDRISGGPVTPDEEEVRAYYRQHPELFAQRRIYRVQQIVVSKSIPFAELQAKTQGAGDTSRLVQWLQERKKLVGVETSLSPAEKISTEILPKLHVMKKGERLAWETPEHHVVVVLLGSTLEPFTEAEASPLIKQYLSGEKRKARGQDELARLRQTATIQWMGGTAKRLPGLEDRPEQEKFSDRYPSNPVNADVDLQKYLPAAR